MIFNIDLRILDALWFILSAYFANSIPVNISKIEELEFLGQPIDGKHTFMGKRIFGDGKTWRGLITGTFGGTFVGFLQQTFHEEATLFFQELLSRPQLVLPYITVEHAFMLSLGALVGDMVASFVKRQRGLERGAPAPLLDQLDFVLGAVIFSWLLTNQINYPRFYVLILITPGIHVLGNIVAWLLKLKDSPW